MLYPALATECFALAESSSPVQPAQSLKPVALAACAIEEVASVAPVARPELFAAEASPHVSSARTAEPGFRVAQVSPAPLTQPPTAPNDRFLQPSPLPTPAEPPSTDLPTPQPSLAPEPSPSSATVLVRKLEVRGSTVFGPAQLNPLTQPFEGRELSVQELQAVADAVTQLYLNNGFITSRALLLDQPIAEGTVVIQVVEGRLEQIEVEGSRRLNPSYIRSRIQRGATVPLSSAKLEDQLRLLRLDPLFENIEASLRAGTQLGQSILTVRVSEAKPLQAGLSFDNYSPPSIGSERIGLDLLYRNLTGRGDELAASYFFSVPEGSDAFDFSYRLPVNSLNGTVQLRLAPNRSQIVQEPFQAFGFRGRADLYELSYRQPLFRTPRQELALSLGFSLQNGQTLISEDIPLSDLDSRTRVLQFGQEYVRRDVRGAWAVRSQFSLGTGWFGATVRSGGQPDGQFFSWLGQVQRVQLLGQNQVLIAQADLQWTPDSLLPSQQFAIGGGQSVRGYRQNLRAGDNGFRLSLEDRITVVRDAGGLPVLQIAPFAEAGAVWNDSDNPNALPSQTFLASVGLGLIWQPIRGVSLRLDYGVPLVSLNDRGQNLQDAGVYFSLSYRI